MSNGKGEGREVKLKTGYGNPATNEKSFTWYEVDGMLKALNRIEQSNPKIPVKVDYWINKNKTPFLKAMSEYIALEKGIFKKYSEVYTNEEFKDKNGNLVEFLVMQGKDASDTILLDGGLTFRLTEKDGKPILDYLQNPSWVLEIPSSDEGKEPTKVNRPYDLKYKTPEDEDTCAKEVADFKDNYKFSVEPYKLKEENLEGINVVWASDKQENLSAFKGYLYDNLIA